MEDISLRYDRQSRINGWNQEKLDKAKLDIVGYNAFSEYLALSSASLGIGDITVISNNGLDMHSCLKNFSNNRLEEIIRKVNPMVNFKILQSPMEFSGEEYLLKDADVVINCSTEKSMGLCFSHCCQNETPLEVVRFNENKLLVSDPIIEGSGNYKNFGDFSSSNEIAQLTSAGIVLEEIKKKIFREENRREDILFDFENLYSKKKNIKTPKILVIGAGALGNFAVLGLAALSTSLKLYIPLTIIDRDSVDETNLNRQILFYDCVGENKAKSLAEKYNRILGRRKANEITEFFDQNTDLSGYDVIFDCVDNFKTRLLASQRAIEEKKVLISGGTSYFAGQALAYIPDKTICPAHAFELERIVMENEKRQRESQSCIYQPDPSVIMSNQIIGGIMDDLFQKFLNNNSESGIIKYDSRLENRIGKIKLEKCRH